MNVYNLVSVMEWARLNPIKNKSGEPVTLPYYYKMIAKGRLKVFEIAGKKFIDKNEKLQEVSSGK